MSVEVLPASLAEHEFSIACEAPRHCDVPAAVMVQGCADTRHKALCVLHLAELKLQFERCKPCVCSVCYRPFMHFETHFTTESI